MSREHATHPAPRAHRAIVRGLGAAVALVLAGCAAGPPLNLYTLSEVSASADSSTTLADPPPRGGPVIEVARVSLPDYLDSEDLLVRQGDVLVRSRTGRWATRLSAAATDLLTSQLAMRLPDAWVTDQPQMRPPDYRLIVHIDRLDITSSGTGIVDADWTIVPSSASGEVIRRRTRFSLNGSVGTDEAVVHLERLLLERLAGEIDVPSAR